jgi:hypothetical protein
MEDGGGGRGRGKREGGWVRRHRTSLVQIIKGGA